MTLPRDALILAERYLDGDLEPVDRQTTSPQGPTR